MTEQYDDGSDSARFKRAAVGGGMVHVVSAVVAEWRTEIHNSTTIGASNIHGSLQQMGASPRERSFSTNPCSPANPSPIEVGRPRYLGPVDLSPAQAGPVIAARVRPSFRRLPC